MDKQTNWVPGQKAISGGLAGIISYFIVMSFHALGVELPMEIQLAIPPVVTWLIFYLVPVADQDVVRNLNNKIVAMAITDQTSPVTQTGIAVEVQKTDFGAGKPH